MKGSNTNKTLATPPPLTLRAGRSFLLLLFLGLAVHLILPQLASVGQFLEVMRRLVGWAVVLSVLSQGLSYAGSGYLVQASIAIVNQHLSFLRGVVITLAASSVGLLAGGPFGNAAATYRWARKFGVSPEGSGLAGALPTLFNNVMLLLLAVTGIIYLMLAHKLSPLQFYSFALILFWLGLVLGAVFWGYRHRAGFTALLLRAGSFFARTLRRPYRPDATKNAVHRMFLSLDALENGGWKKPALGALLNTGFDMLTLYLLFVAVGHRVSPGILLAGYGLPLLFGKMAFLIPGGVGVVESTMAALYTGLGVPEALAVVVILSYRMFSFWFPTLLGFPLVFYLQRM